MAAVLGVRTMNTIQASHSLTIHRRFLWTDSSTVLSWIRSDQHNYKQFTAFRIGEILESTSVAEWRWVETKQNIADVLTKWGKGPPLESDGAWFKGPQFLYRAEEDWPKQKLPAVNTAEEMRAVLLFHNVSLPDSIIEVRNVSRWSKLIRITASVYRFVGNCRRKKAGLPIATTAATPRQFSLLKANLQAEQMPLLSEELQKAESLLWRQAQADAYPDEVKVLLKNLDRRLDQPPFELEKSSELYQCSPILDDEGVVRMDGRVKNAGDVPFDVKFPIILPKTHDITKKLIQHYHERFGHANCETVFNELRQRFW